jgi:hypothetical protein
MVAMSHFLSSLSRKYSDDKKRASAMQSIEEPETILSGEIHQIKVIRG